jgi:dephospho-CoA kinase
VAPIGEIFPAALQDGAIDRVQLKALIARDPAALTWIETIVHPLVAADRAAFLAGAHADMVVLDIPLLFENGMQAQMDATLLVTAPPDLQRARVLLRPGMTDAQFAMLLARQMPDAQKRGLATHIVETLSEPVVRTYVSALIAHIRGSHA